MAGVGLQCQFQSQTIERVIFLIGGIFYALNNGFQGGLLFFQKIRIYFFNGTVPRRQPLKGSINFRQGEHRL